MRTFIWAFSFAVVVSSTPAFALDDASAKALEETQNLMNDPKALQEYAAKNSAAAGANDQVNSLTGGNADDTAAVYQLASQIFGDLAKNSNGDVASMQATLSQAMKNPAAFASKLTPEQSRQLHELAGRIESRPGPTSAPH